MRQAEEGGRYHQSIGHAIHDVDDVAILFAGVRRQPEATADLLRKPHQHGLDSSIDPRTI